MSDKIELKIQVDNTVLNNAKPVFEDAGLSVSEAVEILLCQTNKHRKFPFDIKEAKFRHIANDIKYERIRLFGEEMLYTPERIERSSVPDSVSLYEVEYDDDNIGKPYAVKERIICNFLGSIISKHNLEIPTDDYLFISDSDWVYSGRYTVSLKDWIKEKH